MKGLLQIIFFLSVSWTTAAKSLVIEVLDAKTNSFIATTTCSYKLQGAKRVITNLSSKSLIEIDNVNYPLHFVCRHLNYEPIDLMIRQDNVSLREGKDYILLKMQPITTNLNELVVTGQVMPVLAKQSIYKVNTISSSQIFQRGANTLNDVLTYEMNSFVSNDNVLGSSLNIGGIGSQNIKVLVNGIPIMGRENGNIDMGQLNMANVKRIEMIQGPMSVMYGSNALGGVINLITQTPKKKIGGGIRSYCESIGRYNLAGNLSLHHKKHQLQLSLSRNFFYGWTPKDSIDRFQLWKPKTQYIADAQYWTQVGKLKLNYFSSYLNEKITNKGEPIVNAYEGYAFDEYYRTTRTINSISATLPLDSTRQFNFMGSYQSYVRTKNRLKKDLVNLTEFETLNIGDQDTSSFYNINLRGTYSTKQIKNLDVLLGYEYAQENGVSYRLADEQKQISDLGIFTSALYSHKKWRIQPSVRFTSNNRYGTNLTPAIHLKYDWNEKMQYRASYARGFRAPTLKEMYLQFIDQNHTIIGNPELKPEKGDHVQIGLDYQKQVRRTNLSFSVNGFYNSIENLIALAVYNNHGVLRKYDNIQNYRNIILNLKGACQTKHFGLDASAGIIQVIESSITQEYKIYEFSLGARYLMESLKTTLNFNYKFNSRQPVITIDQQFLYTDPLHIANISLQRSLLRQKLQVQMGVKNLFNLQNMALNGSVGSGSGHANSGSIQLFPARSIFIDLSYLF